MKLPRRVKIGPFVYKVRGGKRAREALTAMNAFGFHRGGHLELLVDRTTKKSIVQETLVHEILHALMSDSSTCLADTLEAAREGLEHEVIHRLSPALVLMLQDNPEVVECLMG